jgi:hypothetical protein
VCPGWGSDSGNYKFSNRGEKYTKEKSNHAKFLRQKSITNNMKTVKNTSGKSISVIDIDDKIQGSQVIFLLS